MRTAQLIALPLVIVAFAACGGEQKHASSPEPVMTSDPSQADMPAAPADKTNEAAPADKTPGETPSLAIKVAPMKLVVAKPGKDDKPVALADDGTISVGGKGIAKIAGDQVDALDGSGTLVTVAMDGSLVGQGVKPGYKFVGDDLVGEDGTKLVVGDDGSLETTKADGKTEVLGKLEGGEKAKRAAALVALITVMSKPAPAAPAAKPKK